MTTNIFIDCLNVTDDNDFYPLFAEQAQLDEHFGANLDALWDVLTTDSSLPVIIRFDNFQSALHAKSLKPIIKLIKEANIELNGAIRLEINHFKTKV